MAESTEVVIFGAGNIGRGLIAESVSSVGWRPVLVEADAALARRLAEAGSYRVRLVGRSRRVRRVDGYEILASDDAAALAQAVATCRFAATAVGGAHLAEVAALLAPGLARRRTPLNVLVCENVPHGDERLRGALDAAGVPPGHAVCVRGSVERMVRKEAGTLDLMGEEGQPVYVDRAAWRGEPPEVPGMVFCDDMEPLYARKLFTSNAGHALLAYLGARRGCEFIHDAAEVPELRRHLCELLDVAGRALARRYGDEAAIRAHVERLLTYRFPNRDLADPVARVARDPLRKLGPEERLVGLARLLQSCGLPTEAVSRAIGAALHYFDPGDAQSVRLRGLLARDGPRGVLRSVCGLDGDEACFHECLRFYASV